MTPEALVSEFTASQPYQLDDFQLDAIRALANRHSVLVAAPTGTGKTIVGEFGIFLARSATHRGRSTPRRSRRSPIRSIATFEPCFGDDQVGLLTGDVVVNRDAPILVMTTEVLRNMLVTGASLDDVGVIVFDEVHYMGDAERGTAWEESILLAPRHVPLVCLSATVPNAAEIAEWIREAHGDLTCVFHDQRAVPLEHRYWLPDADARAARPSRCRPIMDADGQAHHRRAAAPRRGRRAGRPRALGRRLQPGIPRRRADRRRRQGPARAAAAVARRALPGRRGADARDLFLSSVGARRRKPRRAASRCARCRTPPSWSEEAKARLADLSPEDRNLRQVALLLGRFLPRGVAVHHAGLLPQVKLLVEELFQAGKLRAVFATDTLALGINMPARTVVIGEMLKFDGQSRRLLTPNEYRQMTGRAGRRGIDERGVSLLMYSPWVTFPQTAARADQRPAAARKRVPSDVFHGHESLAATRGRGAPRRPVRAQPAPLPARPHAAGADRAQASPRRRVRDDRKPTVAARAEELAERAAELGRVDYELRRARRGGDRRSPPHGRGAGAGARALRLPARRSADLQGARTCAACSTPTR